MTDFDLNIGSDTTDSTTLKATTWFRSLDENEIENDKESTLERFSAGYQSVHGYLSLAICSFGIVSNALNIIVLTRRSMSNATNCLLAALAVTDLLTMIIYVPYAGYFYCYAQPDPAYGHRYPWIVFLLFNSAFSITAHTVAVWLTVSIAVFRYIVVCGRHSLGARLCSRERAHVAVGAVVVTTIVFCVPNYIMYHPTAFGGVAGHRNNAFVNWTSDTTSGSGNDRFFNSSSSSSDVIKTVRVMTTSTLPYRTLDDTSTTTYGLHTTVEVTIGEGGTETSTTANDEIVSADNSNSFWFEENEFITERYRVVNFWLFGVVLKVVPCVLLTVLSGLLVRAMRSADRRRRRLLNAGRRAESDRAGERNRTTAMLVAVVLCFVSTEMPQGILAFLSGVDSRIFASVYVPLGDFWDILVLANSAINFVVYCKMNRRFRRTVIECFCGYIDLERFGLVRVGAPEATIATAGLVSSRPTQTQQASVPLYSIVEPAQYTRM